MQETEKQMQHAPIELEIEDLPEIDDGELEAVEATEGSVPAMARAAGVAGRGGRLAAWTFRAVVAVVGLIASVWVWDFLTGLLARNEILGTVAVFLFGFLGLVLCGLVLREIAAISRLARIETIRAEATLARQTDDVLAARAVAQRLGRLNGGRADTAWGRARLEAGRHSQMQDDELVDAGDILDRLEREILARQDAAALREVQAAAARVATITALVPMALADVAAALYSNVVMIRRIAEIYGGRSGTLGAWRLTRAVVAHLAATGIVAAGDDLVGSALGGGILSKLSRRFGEGLINGALTARVGLTAMELCRPLPFHAETKPKVAATVRGALAGLFKEAGT